MGTISNQQEENDVTEEINECFVLLLKLLNKAKPSERSELARRCTITITDLEKVAAYFEKYIK